MLGLLDSFAGFCCYKALLVATLFFERFERLILSAVFFLYLGEVQVRWTKAFR